MRRFTFRHLPHATPRIVALAGLGAALAIAGLLFLSDATQLAWMVASFGATCVLLFAAPTAIVSQPVNVVAGHVVSSIIGLGLAHILPGSHILAGVAVGLSISVMMVFRIVNPPAGATALVAYTSAAGWWFLLFPVTAGSVGLVLFATVYHRMTGGTYPLPTK